MPLRREAERIKMGFSDGNLDGYVDGGEAMNVDALIENCARRL